MSSAAVFVLAALSATQGAEQSTRAAAQDMGLVLVAIFAFAFLGRPSMQEWLGIGLVAADILAINQDMVAGESDLDACSTRRPRRGVVHRIQRHIASGSTSTAQRSTPLWRAFSA
jgi:hypothetical protein